MENSDDSRKTPGFDLWVLASDPVFYVVTIIFVLGVIIFALSGETETSGFSFDGRHLVIEDEALAGLVPGPGTESEYAPTEHAARITANATFDRAGTLSAGVGLLLPRSFEEDVIGRSVEVTIEMRALQDDHDQAYMSYFTTDAADSPRHVAQLDTDWQTFSFVFVVPPHVVANDQEWIGIWPDLDGLERPVLVRRIEARILDTDE
ncbi:MULTISPECIES: hypothetical protein [Hyphobacterium]|uniref:Uncharacterized protein n=1 Tax=Hyphobacterium vulgare TaxID=1736751 RepID=A0ABV6ZVF1_9PROT